MKKRMIVTLYVILFAVVFIASALISMNITGSAPQRLLKADYNGNVYTDLSYQNANGHKYDLYLPENLDMEETQNLILFIHGGSFNSGSKEEFEAWCRYYAAKGYITATVNYTLQNQGMDADLNLMNEEIKNCVDAIAAYCQTLGIHIEGMAVSGVSAGGTLALNYAYKCAQSSAIPVKFVFQLAAPTYFEPDDWDILMRVNKIKTQREFVETMTGVKISDEQMKNGEYKKYIDEISPSMLVDITSVPTLSGYGLKDHLVPASSRETLITALESNNVAFDYIPFPNSNHGMYADLDALQKFIELSLMYCDRYFNQ